MFSGSVHQLFRDDDAAGISHAGPPEWIADAADDVDSRPNDKRQKKRTRKSDARGARAPAHRSQMAYRLDNQREDDAGHGGGIMRLGPNHGKNSGGAHKESDDE